MPYGMPTGGALSGIRALSGGAQGPEEEPGFLLSLALTLDAPRNWAWGGTSEKRVTGWDVLRKMGIRDKPGKFDPVDVLAFGLEVVGDPLTYLGGLGGLTKVGKLKHGLKATRGVKHAARSSMAAALEGATKYNTRKMIEAARAIEKGDSLKNITKGLELTGSEAKRFKRGVSAYQRATKAKARTHTLQKQLKEMGESEDLADLWSEAAKNTLPERKLLSVQVPFTDIEKVLIRGAPVLGAIQSTGKLLGKAPPIQAMGRLISTAFQRSDELKPYMHEYNTQTRMIMREAKETGDELGDEINKLHGLEGAERLKAGEWVAPDGTVTKIEELGDYTEDMFFTDIINARESLHATPRIIAAKNEVVTKIMGRVEKRRGQARKRYGQHLHRLLLNEKRRNEISATRFETEARVLEKVGAPTKSELRIQNRISTLGERMKNDLDQISVQANDQMSEAAEILAERREAYDTAYYNQVRADVSIDSLQKELDELAPGYRVKVKGGQFDGFQKVGKKKRKPLDEKGLSQKHGHETEDAFKKSIQDSLDEITSLRSEKTKFKADAKTKLRELDEQFDFIEKQMDGTWRIENAPYKGGVTGTSTFAGYDTLGSGFSAELGFRFTHHVEFDDDTVRMLSDKTGETIPKRNVRDTDEIIKEVQKGSRDDPNHLFHASPECKRCSGASRATELTDDDYLNAKAVVDILKKGNAPVVTIENVPQYKTFQYTGKLLGRRKKPYNPFDEIVDTLEKHGYVVDFHTTNAADYGAATSRNRLFIRAIKKKVKVDGKVRDTLRKEFRDVDTKVNRVTGESVLTQQHPLALPAAQKSDWLESIKDLLPRNWQLMGKEKLRAHGILDDTEFLAGTGRSKSELKKIKEKIADETNPLHTDSPILTSGGGGTQFQPYNAGRPGGTVLTADSVSRVIFPAKNGSLDPADGARAIRTTPRMLARLMGLPDDMPLPKARRGKPGSIEALTNEIVRAKNAIGNGIHGVHTKAVIESLLKGRIAGSAGKKPNIWEMTVEEFEAAAARGKIHQATGKTLAGEAEAQTPLRMGEINKYSQDDIAHFYSERAKHPEYWEMRGQPDGSLTAQRDSRYAAMEGLEELVNDAVGEGRLAEDYVIPTVSKRTEGVAPIAAKANRRQTFKYANAEARHKAGLLTERFKLSDAQDKTATRVRDLRGRADKIRQEIKDDKALREAAYERAENAIPKIENIKGDPLEIKDQVASLGRGEGQHKFPKLGQNIKGDLVKSLTKTLQDKEEMLDALSKNLDESEAAMSLLTPKSRALVEHLDQETGELLARRVASGATEQATKLTARLQSVTKNYSERVLTGEAREWLLARRATDGKGGTMLDMFHRHMGRFSKSKMSAKTGGDIPRLDQYREEFTSAVNGFFEKLPGNRPAQWFDKDFSVTYPGKYIGDERSVLNATFVKGLGDDIVENIDLNDLNDVASKVSLAEFYIEHGIHRIKHNGKIVVIGDSKGLQKGMRDAGLFKRGIRHEIADEIRGITTKLVDSDDMSHLGEIYDKMVLGPLRWSLTRPWLPFHLRNFTTNIFLNWLGGVSNPKYYKQAFKVVWNKDQTEELGRLHDLGVVTGGWAKEAARELTEGGRIKVWSNLEKWFKEKYPKGSEAWKKYTSFTEDMGRAAHYYGKKADGLTDFEALESVNKYLLDYSDLTNFERRYGKRMFMFYNWTRKMIPMLTKEFISNPHKMAALMRGSVQPSLLRPEGLPEYIKASFALPLPWKDKQGREQFITTFGSPVEEFRKFDISQHEGGLVGRGTELARTIIGQMTPPFKQAAEIAAGKDFFYRKPIQEADRVKQMFGLEKLLPGLRTDVLKSGKTRLRADPDMLYALRQSPASRLISTLQKLGDPDRNLADKLFATLSGINVARFYKETQAPRVKVEQLMAMLKRKIPEGQARKFETVYLTEAGKKNRDATMLMEALRAAEKKSRAVYQTSGGKL